MEIDEPLVDSHLVAIVCVGSLTTRGFPCGDLEAFGGHANRTPDSELLILGLSDQIAANYDMNIRGDEWKCLVELHP